MNQKLYLSAILIAMIAATLGTDTAAAQDRTVLANAERITGDKFTAAVRTPRGVNVYGVSRPSRAVLIAIDKGLADLFAIARRHRYSRRLNSSDYSVYIAKADRTKDSQGAYSPDIAVGAGGYAGSIFDQGGYVYAAGMVIANDPCSFVIAEHTRDLDRVSNVFRYEGEHIVLYHNDRRKYNQTADHSKGGAHPILQ